MKTKTIVAALALLNTGPAMASTTITFEDWMGTSGTPVGLAGDGLNLWSGFRLGGVGVSVNSNGDHDRFLLFETGVLWPRDPDLYVDNGRGIAIAENKRDEPGDGSRIDDERDGGTIRFDFDSPVTLMTYNFVDIEEGAYVRWSTGQTLEWRTENGELHGLNYEFFSKPQDWVEFTFNGSGAVTDLSFVGVNPIPEAGTLALSTLALLPLMRKRRS